METAPVLFWIQGRFLVAAHTAFIDQPPNILKTHPLDREWGLGYETQTLFNLGTLTPVTAELHIQTYKYVHTCKCHTSLDYFLSIKTLTSLQLEPLGLNFDNKYLQPSICRNLRFGQQDTFTLFYYNTSHFTIILQSCVYGPGNLNTCNFPTVKSECHRKQTKGMLAVLGGVTWGCSFSLFKRILEAPTQKCGFPGIPPGVYSKRKNHCCKNMYFIHTFMIYNKYILQIGAHMYLENIWLILKVLVCPKRQTELHLQGWPNRISGAAFT